MFIEAVFQMASITGENPAINHSPGVPLDYVLSYLDNLDIQ